MFLASSHNDPVSMQQEFHSCFLSASVGRQNARVWSVLCVHFCLLWVYFHMVSINGMLIVASFSNRHENR